ncbi:MAG: family 4 glycosyl hydrolase [Promethearchaeota archaeon]
MSEKLHLTYIGAGSHRFSFGLFANVIAAEELHPIDVMLYDTQESVAKWAGKLLKHMAEKANVRVNVNWTTKQREALDGADFIYKSISIGTQAAEWIDNYIPMKFGIPQNTGDTVGPGGFFRGLRLAPVIDKLVKDMKELCPDAVLLNYTNPQASIVRAAKNAWKDVKYIGLCHELFGGMHAIQDLMNRIGYKTESWEEFDINYVGVNHFAWLEKIMLNGEDLTPKLMENQKMAYEKKIGGRTFNWYLLKEYGYFPYPGSRHVAEFMPEYFNYFNHQNAFGIVPLRDVRALANKHRWVFRKFNIMSRDFFKDYVPGPSKKGERAMEMTYDWKNNIPTHHVVNIENNGLVSNLPDNAIIEVPGYFKDGNLYGVPRGPAPEVIKELLMPHIKVQNMVATAGVKGDRDLLLKGLLSDPMVAFIEDEEKIEHMMDIMLYYMQDYLPVFKEAGVIPKYEELEKRKYWVAPDEISTFSKCQIVKYPPKDEIKKKIKP